MELLGNRSPMAIIVCNLNGIYFCRANLLQNKHPSRRHTSDLEVNDTKTSNSLIRNCVPEVTWSNPRN
jgi:hypothetical protein